MENDQMSSIDGVVERVLFKNINNGYVVLELDMGESMTVVVGILGSIDEGEELRVTGEYINHPKFGAQFKAQLCERKLPETAHAIQKYLSSGAIKGIGLALAKKIVEEFGEKTLDIMENDPQKMLQIQGITPKKLDKITQELGKIFGIRRLMMYLAQYGLSPSIAIRVWHKWGQFAVDIVSENPYALCDFGVELDFYKAEEIAEKMEIPSDSKERIRAGIAYILTDNSYNGHTCLPTDKLCSKACEIMEINEQAFYETLEKEYNEETLVEYKKGNRCYTYLYDFFVAEKYIAGRMGVMKDFFLDSERDYCDIINLAEEQSGIKYESLQREAIGLALSKGFMILTGGPGTGKTTTLNAIISLYEQQGERVMIAAPTGRAAKRISDLTGYDASTIHRLLEVSYENDGKIKFIHDENNPIACDVLIVDEMSMVDTLLFESLLRAMKLACRLILVGDCDQLPSVGAGNLLKDMIDSGTITVVQLKEIFRQSEKSGIITSAHRIVQGEMPDITQKDSDFFFLQRLNGDEALDTMVDLYKRRLPKTYGFSPFNDIQILSPTRKGQLGVVELNKRLQLEINPPSAKKNEVRGMLYSFRDGDKVMQTKNNYEIVWSKEKEPGTGIFNGDMGTIIEVKKSAGIVSIDFEGRVTDYSLDMLDQLELAYAITVHKSQGSEFPAVIIPLLGGFDKLYYRSLLYTAVTRAKKLLIIVGSRTRLLSMVENNRKTLRYSCLRAMLIEQLKSLPKGGSLDGQSQEKADKAVSTGHILPE